MRQVMLDTLNFKPAIALGHTASISHQLLNALHF